MIPRFRPALGWKELLAALKSWPMKDDIACFERAFAKKMEQKQAVAFPYGRTGLFFLLKALGLKGKEIICPAYTCVVVAHAIVKSGNTPVFIDSCENDYNMDLDRTRQAINEKTGAIIATSIFGYPVNLQKLEEIKNDFPHVHIIQDCAHSFSAEWENRPVQKEGCAAIFGLNISKLVVSIFGGMVTTDNEGLAIRLRNLRQEYIVTPNFSKSLKRFIYLLLVYPSFCSIGYGLINAIERRGWLDEFSKYYNENRIDMPSDYLEGMTQLEARVGETHLLRLEDTIRHRKTIAEQYRKALNGVSGLILPPVCDGATYSHYVPRVSNRIELTRAMLRKGVQLGVLIEYVVPNMPVYQPFSDEADFKNSEKFSTSTINLPLHISRLQCKRVVRLLVTSLSEIGRDH